MLWVAYLWLTGQTGRIVDGWSSLMAISLIASGIIMILLGFIGVYVGYIFRKSSAVPFILLREENKDGEQ